MFASNYNPIKSLDKYIAQRELARVFTQVIKQNKLHERGERSSCWKMDVVEVSHGRFSIVLYALCEVDVAISWAINESIPRSYMIACAYSVPKKSYNAAYRAMCRL